MMARTLGDKLQEIGRRSPKGVKALEVLVDFFLDELGPEDESTKPHVWLCDSAAVLDPKPKKGGA